MFFPLGHFCIFICVVPDRVSDLNATLSPTNNTSVANISWVNPSGVWDNVTISCVPDCQSKTVGNTTTSTSISGLSPGQSYTFSAVVTSNDQNSTPVTTPNSLTIGTSSIIGVQLLCKSIQLSMAFRS